MNPNHPLTKLRIERLSALLKKSDLSQHELADLAFITQNTAYRFTRLMLELELIHITRWTSPSGHGVPIPVLRFGPGISAPRPGRMSDQKRNARWRAALQHDIERLDRLRSAKNARRRKITADPLVAWIPVRSAPGASA